eukprot:358943-Chlamydomonas_euryale.AAC.2
MDGWMDGTWVVVGATRAGIMFMVAPSPPSCPLPRNAAHAFGHRRTSAMFLRTARPSASSISPCGPHSCMTIEFSSATSSDPKCPSGTNGTGTAAPSCCGTGDDSGGSGRASGSGSGGAANGAVLDGP